jgi:micrococcal nuclease
MSIISIFAVLLGLSHPAPAVEFNKYPTRVDHYPGSTQWPVCAGKREKMSECVTDGDTIRIQYRAYRLADLDTPETKASNRCKSSKVESDMKKLGLEAKETTRQLLSVAKKIDVTVYVDPLTKDTVKDKYGRVLSKVSVDGQDLATILISKGLGKHYDGGKKTKWCD